MKPIILKTRCVNQQTGIVRLTPEAEQVVRKLCRRSGQSACYVVSEIILQSEHLIDVERVEDDDQL